MSEQEPLQSWMGGAVDVAELYTEDEIGEVVRKIKDAEDEGEQLKISAQISALSLQVRAEIMTRTGVVFGRWHSDASDFVEGSVQESLKPFTKENVTSVIAGISAEKRVGVVAEIASVMKDLMAKVTAVFNPVVARKADREQLSRESDELEGENVDNLYKVFNIMRKLLGCTQRELSAETGICQSQISNTFSGLKLGKRSQRKMFNWIKNKAEVVTEVLNGGDHGLTEEEAKLIAGFFRRYKFVGGSGGMKRRKREKAGPSGKEELMKDSLLKRVFQMTMKLFDIKKTFLGVQMRISSADLTRIFWGAELKGIVARRVTGWFLKEKDNLLAKLGDDCAVLGADEIKEFRGFLGSLKQAPIPGADDLCKVFNMGRILLDRRQVEVSVSIGVSLSSLSIIAAGKKVNTRVREGMCTWLLENRDGIFAVLNKETESLFNPEDILVLREFLPSLT